MFLRNPIKLTALLFSTALVCCTSADRPVRFLPIQETDYIDLSGKGTVLNDDFLFGGLASMEIYDSLLLVFHPVQMPYVVNVFSKRTGREIANFGSAGRGPGETILPESFALDREHAVIWIYDRNLRKIETHDLVKILWGDVPDIYHTLLFEPSIPLIRSIARIGNSFLLIGQNADLRYGILDRDHGFTSLTTEYPILAEPARDNISVWNYSPKIGVRPDGRKFVNGTYIGKALEICSWDEHGLKTDTLIAMEEPVYRHVGDMAISTSDKTKYGFEDIYATNDHIYLLEANPKIDDPGEIIKLRVADWKGHILKTYIFDEWIFSIAVDEGDGTLYCLSEVAGTGYVLKSYGLE